MLDRAGRELDRPVDVLLQVDLGGPEGEEAMPVSRRRLLVLGALVAAPVIAYSQGDRRVRRIGIIDYSAAEPGRLGWWKAFRQRLGELGYVEGKNLVVEARFAAGSEAELAALAAELVKLKVELIATGGTITALAVRKATHDIPIVTATGIDPLRVGLVKTLARPGTNVTGVVSLNDQLALDGICQRQLGLGRLRHLAQPRLQRFISRPRELF